jgi:mannan endo-1,4-beta-mannosidase
VSGQLGSSGAGGADPNAWIKECVPLAKVPLGDGTKASQREWLRARLTALTSDCHIALGHQDTSAYGVGWEFEPDRSDFKSVCGDYPAVQGWDLGHIGLEKNIDGVPFTLIRDRIIAAHERGAIITISWHEWNPITGGNAWDTSQGGHEVLDGGTKHEAFLARLDLVAEFMDSLVTEGGAYVPVLFRPYHEHTGSWFWWGRDITPSADYVALWQMTWKYLRETKGLEQLLFAFSPNGLFNTTDDYLYAYPGDDYVDVLGFDYYFGNVPARVITRTAELVVGIAEKRGKIPAFTEFGARDGLSNPDIGATWFTENVFGPLLASAKARRIAYALTWRNDSTSHYFVPYPGEKHEADFKAICEHGATLTESQLP